MLLTGGTVLTMDPSGSTAEAVAISGGRILAVGSAGDLAALAGPATEVIRSRRPHGHSGHHRYACAHGAGRPEDAAPLAGGGAIGWRRARRHSPRRPRCAAGHLDHHHAGGPAALLLRRAADPCRAAHAEPRRARSRGSRPSRLHRRGLHQLGRAAGLYGAEQQSPGPARHRPQHQGDRGQRRDRARAGHRASRPASSSTATGGRPPTSTYCAASPASTSPSASSACSARSRRTTPSARRASTKATAPRPRPSPSTASCGSGAS